MSAPSLALDLRYGPVTWAVILGAHGLGMVAVALASLPVAATVVAAGLVLASAIWHSRAVIPVLRHVCLERVEIDAVGVRARQGDGRWIEGLRLACVQPDPLGVRLELTTAGGGRRTAWVAWERLDPEQTWALRRLAR